MRRVGHILLLVPVLLTAATLGLWVRSYGTYDTLAWSRWRNTAGQYDGVAYNLLSGRGVIGLSSIRLQAFPAVAASRNSMGWSRGSGKAEDFALPKDTRWERIGFGRYELSSQVSGVGDASVASTTWWVPHWFLAMLFVLPVALWFAISRPLRARRRRASGQCVRCGYDLRASTDRCPECGTPIPIRGTSP